MILHTLGRLLHAWRKLQTLCLGHYWRRRFSSCGERVSIGEGFQAYAPERITIGRDVIIAKRVTLRAMTTYPWAQPPQEFSPSITLHDGCFINNGSQIVAIDRVTIGRNVMIAENCFIADNNHGWANPEAPIKHQPLTSKGPVTIGDDSWLGANVVVAAGVSIGRHCVIGANSVVTRDIPDHSMAAGAPARIIKQWNPETNEWAPSP
ncbi:MAG TPA: acyltransferase [Kiritimatiellia bacterium]|nr:acyltransferase [Kiritimatiellia bacterium]HMO99335.1 acyltransferase [Kiritimatiellia bacterium]HMP96093.1 acyltransferase [Kiritimatiellia bacterium]